MKKRVLAGMLMMILVLASAMSVSAANSRTENVYTSGESVSHYTLDDSDGVFADLDDKVEATIKELNANKATSLSLDIQKALKGKTLLAKVFDLEPVGDHSKCVGENGRGYHEIELTVTTITDKCSNIVVLHYSETRQVWEIVKPVKVDGNKITIQLKDLSPVAIYANVAGGTAVGVSPSTEGTSSAWMLYSAMALIVLGAGVVVSQKKRG